MNIDELEHEFYEDLNGAIAAVSRVGDDLHLAFECDYWRDYTSRLYLTICCSGVAESTATPSTTGLFLRSENHPLLWQHNEAHADLFFSTAPSNEFELLGRLHDAHSQLFKGWRAQADYIRATPDILRAGYGLLARGPQRAISAYREVAAAFIRCSFIPAHTPRPGNQLVLFDECFVICRHVSILQSKSNL